MTRWRWICLNCGFVHISECPREHIEEVLAAGAWCPHCNNKELRGPYDDQTDAAVDLYVG